MMQMGKSNFLYGKEAVCTEWMEPCAKKFRYPPGVKVNNWIEDRADFSYLTTRRTLLSDYEHGYKTTALTSFKHPLSYTNPELVKSGALILSKEGHVFPGHQPELDLPDSKMKYMSYETTSLASYMPPDLQRRPLATLIAPEKYEKEDVMKDMRQTFPMQNDKK